MDSSFFQIVKTKQDLDILRREIDILEDSLFRTGEQSYEAVLESQVRSTTAPLFESTGSSRDLRKQRLSNIRENLRNAQIIKLSIAFEPKKQFAEIIVKWIRQNIKPDLVLDINYDPSLIAGAVIEYQSKFIDLSLREKFENFSE